MKACGAEVPAGTFGKNISTYEYIRGLSSDKALVP